MSDQTENDDSTTLFTATLLIKMTQKTYLPLPGAPQGYESQEEQTFRRTVEQNFKDVATDVNNLESAEASSISKTMRKYQFLFMGASNG